MRLRPDIVSPCPVSDRLNAWMDGDICRHCDKRVFDLDTMSDAACARLLSQADASICVKYRAPVSASLAAAALAVAALPTTALAQVDDKDVSSGQANEAQEIVVGGARLLTADERRQIRLEEAWEAERAGRKRRKEEWLRARSKT